MHTTNSGATVGLVVEQGSLVVKPHKPHYTLAELLLCSDYENLPDDDTRDWLDAPVVGKEIL